ncbi:leucine-rich repeat and IQ domain-containing protein 1 isoform X2 [Scophthalmus maximus]|uniref:leucine-rich repeat and IQ domain-containing protein 1 isoform X2 n=1 Tax=Scophthalmus maximus TaxID=52904 RepID=UPI001FA8F80B|nr:leucine-rich repeat and IQ domain-containing protein 1 isoform X2 [Scophthalmus maximus]
MTDASELCETSMRELNGVVVSDTGETEEEREQGSLAWPEETVSDDIPPSLLSYFETSKSRAAVCEQFILAELEDFTASHHTEDTMDFNHELDKDMMQLNMKVTCETENEENLLTPKEAEALFSHIVPVCPDSEDEAETDEYMGREGNQELEARTVKRSAREEEMKRSSESQRERRERRHREETKTEERRRQMQRDFQEELNKLMEAEKRHQREVELMGMRAQEKIEQEFLLQQELISNLQERVKEERRRREEEEQKRMKEEGEKKRKEEEEKKKKEVEDRRKKEEEAIKREMERKKVQEEMRRRKEDEEKRKIEEVKLREKHRRKKEEEQRKREEEEKRRKEEKERAKKEEETNKIQEDMRKKEEERKRKEIRLKEEETRRKMEEEERKRKETEEKIKERENSRESEGEKVEIRKMKQITAKKTMEEERGRKNAEEIGLKEEIRMKEKEDRRDSAEEDERRAEEARITEELEVRVNEEEMRKREEERISEEETRRLEVETLMKRQEEENGETRLMPLEEEEKRLSMEGRDKRKEEEKRTQGEEQRKWREEEMRRRREEKTNIQKEMMDWDEVCEADDGKAEHQREDAKRNIVAEEAVRKNPGEDSQTEERKVKEEEERNHIRGRDTEEDGRLDVREKKRGSHNESESTENTGHSPTSQLESGSAPNQPSPGPATGESTATCSHTPQQLHPNNATCGDAQGAEVTPCTLSASSPACLPERTEQRRLRWMKECIPWSKPSPQNKSMQRGRGRGRRGPSRAAGAGGLPPLCPQTLLQSAGLKSLQEVTTVTLEDLPGCSLVTLAQCARLRSLTLRRCGLRSLEGVNQLPQLCHIDVQENDISFVDCENMSSLRVLRLGHNKLTSIHGLSGADNLDVLDLSHNCISRIAGLESVRRLQWLSLDHNQLISTKGLREIYTLLHLDCSHNHLAGVEGLENSALLHTLDLRSNSLTEPPSLDNHVLLRELQLDDNSISSLQGLALCWLPLMHRLSAAQNRITFLPSMSDFVSLASLDLQFNCMSELHNVCESAEGCQFLREVHLTGNPLQQESGWRSTLQKAVAGLRAIDGEETDSSPSAPAARRGGSASGSFLTFCQAQLEQTRDLQRRQRMELSNASSPLDAVKSSCRHFSETLKLAVDQRFAHEYGDTVVSAGQATLEETVDMDGASAEKLAEHSEMKSAERVPPVFPNGVSVHCSSWNLEEKSPAESGLDTFDSVGSIQKTGPHSLSTKEESTSSHLEMSPVSDHQDLDPRSTAAVVIQRRWRKYRQKCGNISSPPTAEEEGGRGGDKGKPESTPSCVDRSAVGQVYAATIIQAFWRGSALRRRLASALAAVTSSDSGEDGAFEEVDVDGFDFDEAALEIHWRLPLSEDSSYRHPPVSEQPLRLKPPGLLPDPPQYTLPPTPLLRPKQAWVAGEQMDSSGQSVSPDSSNRSKSASASVLSGLSARSEQILEEWGFSDSNTALLMLKRAQKMGSKKPQQRKHRDPSDCLALFRNQHSPVEARNRPALPNRCHMKVFKAELGLQPEERTEQVKRERAQQWLRAQSDRGSERLTQGTLNVYITPVDCGPAAAAAAVQLPSPAKRETILTETRWAAQGWTSRLLSSSSRHHRKRNASPSETTPSS